MTEAEHVRLNELVLLGYGSTENYVARAEPNPGFFDTLRAEIQKAPKSTEWYRRRLIEELARSGRCEDAAYLLRVSREIEDKRLSEYALEAAATVARRVTTESVAASRP